MKSRRRCGLSIALPDLLAALSLTAMLFVGCAPSHTSAGTLQEEVEEVMASTVPSTSKPVATLPPEPVSADETGPRQGGTLVIGLDDVILSLDPADYRHRQTETVIRNMFDGLVTRTPDGQVVPEIAESFRWTDDETLEFVLRQGILFHNDEPLTADDVQFTFERIIAENGIEYPEPHTSPRRALLGPLESVEVADTYRVRFHFGSPWPVALQMLVHQHIVPKDYFEQVGNADFVQAPIGSGPFKFVEGDLSEQVKMTRFEDYYGGAPGLPPVGPAPIDQVIFQFIPEAALRVAALQTGEVDIIQTVPSYLIPALAVDSNIEVKAAPGTRPVWMEMNVNRPPFDDVRVRKVMNYSVDADLIVSTFLGGLGTVIPGPLSPHNHFADLALEPYGYNPSRALDLLAETGYSAQDISFVIDCREGEREYAEAVAAQLRELGMDTTVQVWDYSELRPLLLAGERMAYVGGWGDSAFDPVGHFDAKWHSRVEGSDYGSGNFSGYGNPTVDELIEAGEVEPDVETRHQIYDQAQRIVYEEAPAVFLFLPDVVEASSARVRNWVPSSDGRLNMHDVWLSN
jgi:peptide/nickel transport system substrate-binding protein